VWNTDSVCSAETCKMTPYTAAGQFRSVTDLSGKTSAIPANHVVDIGAKPILIGMD